jgi:hypothetical protein
MDPLGFAIALDEIYVETSGSRARSAQEDHVIVIGFAQDGFLLIITYGIVKVVVSARTPS